jgi:hypothetical protein
VVDGDAEPVDPVEEVGLLEALCVGVLEGDAELPGADVGAVTGVDEPPTGLPATVTCRPPVGVPVSASKGAGPVGLLTGAFPVPAFPTTMAPPVAPADAAVDSPATVEVTVATALGPWCRSCDSHIAPVAVVTIKPAAPARATLR